MNRWTAFVDTVRAALSEERGHLSTTPKISFIIFIVQSQSSLCFQDTLRLHTSSLSVLPLLFHTIFMVLAQLIWGVKDKIYVTTYTGKDEQRSVTDNTLSLSAMNLSLRLCCYHWQFVACMIMYKRPYGADTFEDSMFADLVHFTSNECKINTAQSKTQNIELRFAYTKHGMRSNYNFLYCSKSHDICESVYYDDSVMTEVYVFRILGLDLIPCNLLDTAHSLSLLTTVSHGLYFCKLTFHYYTWFAVRLQLTLRKASSFWCFWQFG